MKCSLIVLSIQALVTLSYASNSDTPFTDSYRDCVNLITNFELTYNGNGRTPQEMYPYGNGDAVNFELVTCSNAGICPDSVARTTCAW